MRELHTPWLTELLIGLLLMGWGGFNPVEEVIDHQIQGIHHVNEKASVKQWTAWDLGCPAWVAIMRLGGWIATRTGDVEQEEAVAARFERSRGAICGACKPLRRTDMFTGSVHLPPARLIGKGWHV